MTPAPEDFRAFRFSMDDLPARERDEAFREIYGRVIMKLALEPKPEIRFTMDMELRALPDFGLAVGTCMPVNCRRLPQLIDGDDLILVVARAGGGVFRAPGKEADIHAGQAVLTDSTETGSFDV